MSDTEASIDLVTAPPGETPDQREERLHELAQHPEQLPMLPGELTPHATPRQYVLIAVVLCILTAIEVGLYYLEGDVNDNLLIAMLVSLAVVKFYLVASWYMHMRNDAPFFKRIFVVGIGLAIVVYGAVLLTFASSVLSA